MDADDRALTYGLIGGALVGFVCGGVLIGNIVDSFNDVYYEEVIADYPDRVEQIRKAVLAEREAKQLRGEVGHGGE